jgi:hypothetical protein
MFAFSCLLLKSTQFFLSSFILFLSKRLFYKGLHLYQSIGLFSHSLLEKANIITGQNLFLYKTFN